MELMGYGWLKSCGGHLYLTKPTARLYDPASAWYRRALDALDLFSARRFMAAGTSGLVVLVPSTIAEEQTGSTHESARFAQPQRGTRGDPGDS